MAQVFPEPVFCQKSFEFEKICMALAHGRHAQIEKGLAKLAMRGKLEQNGYWLNPTASVLLPASWCGRLAPAVAVVVLAPRAPMW